MADQKAYSNQERPIDISEARSTYSSTEARSLESSFKTLTDDLTRLVTKESELVRQEISEKATMLKAGGVAMAVGGSIAYIGVQALVATAIIALNSVWSLWVSAFVVGVSLLVVGLIAFASGKSKYKAEKLRPDRTINSVHEITDRIKEKGHDFRTKK